MSDDITKEADALLCLLYKSYLEQRNKGVDKEDAVFFQNSEYIQNSFVNKWSVSDVESSCAELGDAGLLNYKSFIACDEVELSNKGIVYMENRFEKKIVKLLDYLNSIKDMLF